MFFASFRKDHARYAKNFFDTTHSTKNIRYLQYQEDQLFVFYDDSTQRKVSYVYLQKRELSVSIQDIQHYFITEDAFLPNAPPLSEVIPRNVYLTWQSAPFPPQMQKNVERLKAQNPEFTFHFYDDAQCIAFLEEHFPAAVAAAFQALEPGAFKADLWRLCILYVYGGIYLDIKFHNRNAFSLLSLLDREYFVWDGDFYYQSKRYKSLYNGLLVCKKGNPMLYKAIAYILRNVEEQSYLESPYQVTGPQLLGMCYATATEIEPLYLTHTGDGKNVKNIRIGDQIILAHYKEYRQEVPRGASYYYHA